MNRLYVNEVVDSISHTHKFKQEKLYAINTSDVLEGKFLDIPLLPVKELKGQFKKTIKKGDILFSEIRPANKRYAKVVIDNTEDYVVSTKLMVLRKKTDEVDLDYFYYWLTNNMFLKVLQSRAENRIGSFPQITFDLLSEYSIPVPELPKQKKIAQVLSVIDNKISNNNAINAELEAMAKTIYDYWFLQFEFPDENGKPYKSSGGKMVWNEELKQEIPYGWSVDCLKGKYNILRGLSYSSDDIKTGKGIPMINLASVDKNRNYKNDGLKYHNGNVPTECILNAGDLLIACTDLTRNADIVGCPILVPNDGNQYTFSMDMAKLTSASENIDELYLYMTLRTDFYHNFIKKWASGTNVLHLKLEGLDWYQTWFPPIELQKKYAKLICDTHKKKSQVLMENQELASLRDFLLPLLMNGQVTFKEN